MPETPYEREPGYALRYRDRRFRTGSGARTDRRERAALRALLRGLDAEPGPWLDAPCGAGRLSNELAAVAAGAVVRVDRDRAMVAACAPDGRRACASVHALPFADGAFAGVLCHRLLQHIPTPAERIDILRELGRVARRFVVVSFFDACSLGALRRPLRRWLGKTRSGRSAQTRAALRRELAAAGLRPLRFRALVRFLSEQTLVVCVPAPRDP